nr:hypothetical protein CFP56_67834 [Quercus suber]
MIQILYNDVYVLDIVTGVWTNAIMTGARSSARAFMIGASLDLQLSKLSVSARDTCVGLKVSEVNLLSQIDQIKESQAIGIGTVSPCVLPPPLHNPTTCISFMK